MREIDKPNKPISRLFVKKCARGQGVIEYAGALVVASLLISLVMVGGFGGIQDIYNDINTAILAFFNTALAAL